jgi:hypothetical protein
MTPLEFTRQIAKELETSLLPKPINAQVGEVIIPCPGTIVSILIVSEIDLGGNCGSIPVGDVVISAAYDCSFTANDDGTTNWPKQDEVSALLDTAGDFLLAWADEARADAVYRGGMPSVTFLQIGGLAIATLSVSLPIP